MDPSCGIRRLWFRLYILLLLTEETGAFPTAEALRIANRPITATSAATIMLFVNIFRFIFPPPFPLVGCFL